jgi:hypothetical protein
LVNQGVALTANLGQIMTLDWLFDSVWYPDVASFKLQSLRDIA